MTEFKWWWAPEGKTVDDLIRGLRGAADRLEEMKRRGVSLGRVEVGTPVMTTADPDLAWEYGMDGPSPTEAAWAAGVFEVAGKTEVVDGEFRMSVETTDRDVVERFARLMGGKAAPVPSFIHHPPDWFVGKQVLTDGLGEDLGWVEVVGLKGEDLVGTPVDSPGPVLLRRDQVEEVRLFDEDGTDRYAMPMFKDEDGHPCIVVEGHGVVRVDLAVAQAWVPNPDNKPNVRHKDGDITNNRPDNLEWVD